MKKLLCRIFGHPSGVVTMSYTSQDGRQGAYVTYATTTRCPRCGEIITFK